GLGVVALMVVLHRVAGRKGGASPGGARASAGQAGEQAAQREMAAARAERLKARLKAQQESAKTQQEAAARADKGPAKAAKKTVPKTYERPSGFRKGVREKVWEKAKGPDGKVKDPGTSQEMKFDDPWDMGHKPGYEFRKHQQSAMDRGIDRQQF